MFEEKLARKILRSPPKKFGMKVNLIEEYEDISSIKVDEHIGSLLNVEMVVNKKIEKKRKGIAFKADVEDDKEQDIKDIDDNMFKFIPLLAKTFGKVMRRLNRRYRNNVMTNVKDKVPNKRRGFNFQRRNKEGDKLNKGNGVQCHECDIVCNHQ